MKGYQPRTDTVQGEKGDLVINCHSILARWRNHFSQLLNVPGCNNVRQTEICTAEPLVPELSTFEVEVAVVKLKRHKSPGADQIPAEMMKAGGMTIHSEIHKFINSVWNKGELPEEWKNDKTGCSNYRCISLLPTTYKTLSSILQSRLTAYAEEVMGILMQQAIY
jgi:hypothetical protein